SQNVAVGDVLYTRVLSLNGTSVMVGMAPIKFPPEVRLSILEFRDSIFGRRRKLSALDLIAIDDLMRDFYFLLKEKVLNPPPPAFSNTDGDPYVPITATYELKCTPQEA